MAYDVIPKLINHSFVAVYTAVNLRKARELYNYSPSSGVREEVDSEPGGDGRSDGSSSCMNWPARERSITVSSYLKLHPRRVPDHEECSKNRDKDFL